MLLLVVKIQTSLVLRTKLIWKSQLRLVILEKLALLGLGLYGGTHGCLELTGKLVHLGKLLLLGLVRFGSKVKILLGFKPHILE